MSKHGYGPCCVKDFTWNGTPTGRIGTCGPVPAYIAGDNPDSAVMLVHDAHGWEWQNLRLLADHYAKEAGGQ
jgi:hypothetical protein